MSKFENAFIDSWGDAITDWSYSELTHKATVYYNKDGKQVSMVIQNASKEFIDWLEDNC